MEDWWLIRDSEGHVGWVLSRMIDVDIPLDLQAYAEGQRIMSAFVLNKVQDGANQIPQYLVLLSESGEGQPYDFDQIRVYTWNLKRHRYETAYHERRLFGVFPTMTGTEDTPNGPEPTFTILVKDDTGRTVPRKYRLNGPIVRRVLFPGEAPASRPKRAGRIGAQR